MELKCTYTEGLIELNIKMRSTVGLLTIDFVFQQEVRGSQIQLWRRHVGWIERK